MVGSTCYCQKRLPNKLGQFEQFKFILSDVMVYVLSGALNKFLPLVVMFLRCMALFLTSISEILLITIIFGFMHEINLNSFMFM